jgi:tungstate transport system permease protein
MLIAFQDALALLTQFDRGVISIVLVSLQVSFTALVLGTLVGLPLGAWLATEQFRGKRALIITINTLMGVPTVIIGVLVYLILSRSGPLGELGWLFTVKGMVVAQFLLTTPLVAALSRQVLEDAWQIHRDTFLSLRFTRFGYIKWLLWDCRFSLTIAILAGLATGHLGSGGGDDCGWQYSELHPHDDYCHRPGNQQRRFTVRTSARHRATSHRAIGQSTHLCSSIDCRTALWLI